MAGELAAAVLRLPRQSRHAATRHDTVVETSAVAVRDEWDEEVESLPRVAAHPPPDGVGDPVLVGETASAGVVLAVEVESSS